MDLQQELLRHTLATLAYRANRATEDAPLEFAEFAGAGRTPLQILAHMGDLFDWAISIAEGHEHWQASKHMGWAEERQRFFEVVGRFDEVLQRKQLATGEADRLFQGPIADALTHVARLRCCGGSQAARSRAKTITWRKLRRARPAPISPCR